MTGVEVTAVATTGIILAMAVVRVARMVRIIDHIVEFLMDIARIWNNWPQGAPFFKADKNFSRSSFLISCSSSGRKLVFSIHAHENV